MIPNSSPIQIFHPALWFRQTFNEIYLCHPNITCTQSVGYAVCHGRTSSTDNPKLKPHSNFTSVLWFRQTFNLPLPSNDPKLKPHSNFSSGFVFRQTFNEIFICHPNITCTESKLVRPHASFVLLEWLMGMTPLQGLFEWLLGMTTGYSRVGVLEWLSGMI